MRAPRRFLGVLRDVAWAGVDWLFLTKAERADERVALRESELLNEAYLAECADRDRRRAAERLGPEGATVRLPPERM